MGGFVAETAIREMVRVGLAPKSSNVVVLGITFKENCPDVRNSKVYDIVMRLKEYGVEPSVVDPWASGDEVKQVYGMQLRESGDIANADCLIVAVAHDEFKELGFERIDAFFGDKPDESKVLLDVKRILDAKRFSVLWKLLAAMSLFTDLNEPAWLEWITGTGCFSCKRFLHLRIAMMFSVEMSMACTIGIF